MTQQVHPKLYATLNDITNFKGLKMRHWNIHRILLIFRSDFHLFKLPDQVSHTDGSLTDTEATVVKFSNHNSPKFNKKAIEKLISKYQECIEAAVGYFDYQILLRSCIIVFSIFINRYEISFCINLLK